MDNNVRRSKVYSYFYGVNTVFQQFLVVVGVLLILVGNVAIVAKQVKAEKIRTEYEQLISVANELEYTYSELYDDFYYDLDWRDRYDMELEKYSKIDVAEGDKYYDEITAINNALEDYLMAKDEADAVYIEWENARYGSDSPLAVIFSVLGGVVIFVAGVWMLVKKLSSKVPGGEQAVDEELSIKIEEAKIKALEKLNIIAEQIERVDPVVLNGISNYSSSNVKSLNFFTALIQRIIKLILSLQTLFFGGIVVAIYGAITMGFAQIGLYAVPVIGMFPLIAFVGMKVYKKYEVESYVSPKTIDKLNKFDPSLIIKLGSDDAIRVSLPAITVYMFGDDQLYTYYQYVDLVTGKVFFEGVQEYFYEDIVAITSTQENKKVFKRYGFLNLFLKTVDYLNESITVVTSGCKHGESYIVPMGQSLLDTKFVGMRNLVRQKKNED